MRDSRASRLTSFMLSVLVVIPGIAVVLLALSRARADSIGLAVAFVIAYGLVDAMSVRLPRGDTVFVDTAVSLSAVVALGADAAVISCLVGTILGAVLHRGRDRSLFTRMREILRRPLMVAGLAVLIIRFLNVDLLAQGEWKSLVVCAGLGLAYSLTDLGLLAGFVAIDTRSSFSRAMDGLWRSLSTLHAAHISLGVATALLLGRVGVWGLWATVALVLLSQYSFNLLLRTRSAYSETIQALMRASELRVDPLVQGHSQRVADIAVGAGRLLGLSSSTLERLNYAALLHEIGRIGMGDETGIQDIAVNHASEGARIVSEIPFLAPTQAMIAHQRDELRGEARTDERVCSRLIGVCCDLDRSVAEESAGTLSAADDMTIMRHLESVTEEGIRLAVYQAAVAWAHS